MTGRSTTLKPQPTVRKRLIERDWEAYYTTESALKIKVPFGRKRRPRSLGWIGSRRPRYLDYLLDLCDPDDGKLFYALVLVCDHFTHEIAADVEENTERMRHLIHSSTNRVFLREDV